MLPGIELMNCPGLAVPNEVMHHVVRVESSFNPFAIGVVGGRLVRQPQNLAEAVSTVRMLERRGYNFSLGVAQVNRYNLGKYGLDSYEKAFEVCPNLQAGSKILAECYGRSSGDWGKSFSCYYSGNFVTGFRHGYVQKIYASINRGATPYSDAQAIAVIGKSSRKDTKAPSALASVSPANPVGPATYAPGRQSGPQRLASVSASQPMAAAMPQMPLPATTMPVAQPLAAAPMMPGPMPAGMGAPGVASQAQSSQPVRVMPMNASAALPQQPAPVAPAAAVAAQGQGDQAFVF